MCVPSDEASGMKLSQYSRGVPIRRTIESVVSFRLTQSPLSQRKREPSGAALESLSLQTRVRVRGDRATNGFKTPGRDGDIGVSHHFETISTIPPVYREVISSAAD